MMRKRERENPCGVCGHYHKYEEGEVCGICGHRIIVSSEKPPVPSQRLPVRDLAGLPLLGELRQRLSLRAAQESGDFKGSQYCTCLSKPVQELVHIPLPSR